MKCDVRRQEILNILAEATKPVSASVLSEKFGVSRQIIVKDIAQIRADGIDVAAFARGYVLENKGRPSKVFKNFHSDEDVEKELTMIVDLGGTVEDVFVYHKAYNKVSAPMNIKSRQDVAKFLDNIATGKSSLLKNVTSGYHYHTVSADSFEILKVIEEKLWENGFLAKLREYEPDELNINTEN